MRYRNYKTYPTKSREVLPNLISESVVDYFIDSNITHPYIINTSLYGKSCNIYLPTTNLIDLKNYLFSKNFDLFNSFSEINFFQEFSPFYSDVLNYGNYYGYAIKNEYNNNPIGKEISLKLSEKYSSISQLTYDIDSNNVVDLSLITTDKELNKELVLEEIKEMGIDSKFNLIHVPNLKEEFLTNNNTIFNHYELPTTNTKFIGSDPMSPNRVIPLYLRHMAKNIVNSSLMDECLISVNYSSNSSVPVSFNINSFGTENYKMKNIYSCVMDVFPLTLKKMKEDINFFTPIYRHSSEVNYFSDETLPWEDTSKSSELIIF